MEYAFSATVYHYSSSPQMSGWIVAFLPKETSIEIRKHFKYLEEGWGRMRVTAKIGETKWQTAIWFDTKQTTYLLPLKADIRKREHIVLNGVVQIILIV